MAAMERSYLGRIAHSLTKEIIVPPISLVCPQVNQISYGMDYQPGD